MVGHSPLPALRHEQWCFNKLLPQCDGLRKKSLKCNHCRKYRQHGRGGQWSPVFICALVAALPPHIAVTEALTLAFMLGIIRHNYFSANIVLEIARFRFYTCTVENEDGQRLEQRMIRHRRLNGCIGGFLYLKLLNNEYKLDIQQ